MSFTKQVKLIICSSDQALVHKNAGKSGFWLFSRDLIIRFFLFFCTKMHISNAQNMAESNF